MRFISMLLAVFFSLSVRAQVQPTPIFQSKSDPIVLFTLKSNHTAVAETWASSIIDASSFAGFNVILFVTGYCGVTSTSYLQVQESTDNVTYYQTALYGLEGHHDEGSIENIVGMVGMKYVKFNLTLTGNPAEPDICTAKGSVVFSPISTAQVVSGTGKTGHYYVGNPVVVGGLDSSLLTQPFQIVNGAVSVTTSPQTGITGPTAQCVTNAAGGTTITIPSNTRILALQNLGPNPVSCTFDGTAPVFGTTGWLLAAYAAGDPADSTGGIPMKSSTVTLKCIASTAAQASGPPDATHGCLQMLTFQ